MAESVAWWNVYSIESRFIFTLETLDIYKNPLKMMYAHLLLHIGIEMKRSLFTLMHDHWEMEWVSFLGEDATPWLACVS